MIVFQVVAGISLHYEENTLWVVNVLTNSAKIFVLI